MKKILVFSGIVAALALVIGVTTVSQAYINPDIELLHDEVGIGVSPIKADRIDMVPGGKYEGRFRVRQTGHETSQIVAEIKPMTAYKNYEVETDRTQITKWTTFKLEGCDVDKVEDGKTYFTMRSKEECYLNYYISVPQNAMGGSQNSAIMVRTETRDDVGAKSGNAGVSYQYQFAYAVYSDVDGPGAVYAGKVLENNVPWILFEPPLGVSSLVENTGNLDFMTKYEVKMNNWFGGKEVYNRSWEGLTFADSKYEDGTQWAEAPVLGLFEVTQTINLLDEKVENQTSSTVTKLVLIIPIWLVLIIIGIILLLIWALYLRIKGKKEKSYKTEAE
ncbi:MAG: hypothetical protein LBL08_00275 [Candidatus Nomurabacteria bacterium]|jgi:hypothetical protein|nr:hypothetical protein [Candidatus Nomurabacteria bacterium]